MTATKAAAMLLSLSLSLCATAAALRAADLVMQFPDAPTDAVVIADDGGIALRTGAHPTTTTWQQRVPADATVTRLGLVPDLDGDLTREVRVLIQRSLEQDLGYPEVLEETWVLSGAAGDILFVLDESAPFDPWADDPADVNHDGEVTFEDDLGVLISLRSRLPLLPRFSRWYDLANDGLVNQDGIVTNPQDSSRGRGSHSGIAHGQPPADPAKLSKVTFSGSHEVRKDYDTANPPTPPGPAPLPPEYPPIWLDSNLDEDADDWTSGDVRAPIAYKAGDPVTIDSVIIAVSPAGEVSLTNAELIGKVGGVEVFSSDDLAYNLAEDEITATNFTGSAASTAGVIDYRENWTIQWEIIYAGPGTQAVNVGASSNHLYFALADPPGEFPLYYSVLDIGVRRADGLDGDDHGAIADAIFEEFTNDQGDGPGTVHRRTDVLEGIDPPHQLTYYGDWLNLDHELQALLAYGDGQCGAWVYLFIRSLHATGIDPVDEGCRVQFTHPATPNGPSSVFLINDWDIDGSHNQHPGTKVDFPSINIPDGFFHGSMSYTWLFDDVIDQPGVDAQGTTNPLSLFPEHYLSLVGGKYYDPSYGKTYGDIGLFESGAVHSFALRFSPTGLTVFEGDVDTDLNGNGVKTDYVSVKAFVISDGNDVGNQLDETIGDILR